MKAALRCRQCGKFKSHAEFRPPIEDPLQAVCDQCAEYVPGTGGLGPATVDFPLRKPRSPEATSPRDLQGIAQALDIPVTAFTRDGKQEETTISKALGVDQLAKQEARRAEWKQAAVTIGETLEQIRQSWGLKPGDTFRKMLRQRKSQEAADRLAKRIASLAKAEIVRRHTEAIEARTARLRRQTARLRRQTKALNFEKAVAEERMITQVHRKQDELTLTMSDFVRRINVVTTNLEAGRLARERQEAANAQRIAAREDRNRSEWAFKAATVTHDPVLRAAYMARAEGRELTDDD
jgi:hypothetical protein